MRTLITITMLSFIMITGLSACDTDDKSSPEPLPQPENTGNENHHPEENMKLKITIGSVIFTATLRDNAAVTALKKLLPMTVTMSELNSNEKYYGLPDNLPTDSSNPGSIQEGDLMLYGSRTLVLFYKSFSTPYSYTRLGRVDDTTGLASVLGSGNVTVTFEPEGKSES